MSNKKRFAGYGALVTHAIFVLVSLVAFIVAGGFVLEYIWSYVLKPLFRWLGA
jgi:hypothetical protein